MSVYSDTFGFRESCQRSHEFTRRGCSKGPTTSIWVGDFLVSTTVKVKQSEQVDIRGGEGEVAATYAAVNATCGEEIIHAPQVVSVENTDVREDTDHSKVFDWAVPKYNTKGKLQWDMDILASNDAFCGVLTDGGNIYFSESVRGSIDSVCGSIHRDLYSPTAYFLDNRNTLENDEDKGLLFVFVDGMLGTHEVRWVDDKTVLTEGLEDAEDITALFKEALNGKGVLESEIYSFGMI